MSRYPLIPSFSDRSLWEQAKGFTLVEVLVAISIFTIAITSIYGVFTSISASKDKLDLNSETYHLARVVLDRIGREVHGIYDHSSDDAAVLEGGFNDKGLVYLELSTTATVSTNIEGKGFASVRYELVEDTESTDGSYVIMRTEEPLLTDINLDNFPAMRMATGIKSLTVRYFSESTWSDKWDQSLQGFPDMLEVMITAYDKEGEEIPFLTAFKLPVNGS
ncbi:general secretion pathway protein J [Desulfuromusa kysingii]|uniref:General secretion pathway protein J n=1 Tax=Desulfuromusa kysingii TaxID=37625 RepID=A0A1H4CSE4_9BACT|nr:prepilin-type N-terminal cleavage/methylation domain-containing protein [Desulfuromusa kysingii]SEA63032.1 general secretion pathway protein J [Desulfuromusa kysingii]